MSNERCKMKAGQVAELNLGTHITSWPFSCLGHLDFILGSLKLFPHRYLVCRLAFGEFESSLHRHLFIKCLFQLFVNVGICGIVRGVTHEKQRKEDLELFLFVGTHEKRWQCCIGNMTHQWPVPQTLYHASQCYNLTEINKSNHCPV